MNTAIDSRDGAQVLVQSNVFDNVTEPIASLYSDDVGYVLSIHCTLARGFVPHLQVPGLMIICVNRYVTASDNDLGGANNTAPAGTITASDIPYDFTLLGSGKVVATVPGEAGAILTW